MPQTQFDPTVTYDQFPTGRTGGSGGVTRSLVDRGATEGPMSDVILSQLAELVHNTQEVARMAGNLEYRLTGRSYPTPERDEPRNGKEDRAPSLLPATIEALSAMLAETRGAMDSLGRMSRESGL